MSTADNALLVAVMRSLDLGKLGGVGRIDIDAATPDGIAAVTVLTMPTHVADRVLKELQLHATDIGRAKQ
jgi:hypothetical protein